MSANYNVVE